MGMSMPGPMSRGHGAGGGPYGDEAGSSPVRCGRLPQTALSEVLS